LLPIVLLKKVPVILSTVKELIKYHEREVSHLGFHQRCFCQHQRSTMDDAPQEDSTVPPYIWEDGQSMNEDEMKLLQDVADQLEQHATGE
jgi:hypothetical protein